MTCYINCGRHSKFVCGVADSPCANGVLWAHGQHKPDKIILVRALREFTAHYHGERNHQGIDNNIIEPGSEVGRKEGDIHRRERLRGMLSYYYRQAA